MDHLDGCFVGRLKWRLDVPLVWATGYNLVAIPIVMGILAPWGIDLSMAVGAIAMSASTIIVAANAQLLRRLRLRQPSIGVAGPVSQPA